MNSSNDTSTIFHEMELNTTQSGIMILLQKCV